MCLFAADAAEVTAPQEAQYESQDDTGTTAVPAQRTPWRPAGRPAVALADSPQALWPRLTRADLLGLTGAVTKFEANVAAIAALRQCEAEDRAPTNAERRTLLRYSGWGGLPASFNLEGEDPSWVERTRQLQALLSAEDHESARASVNNSHYTEVHAIEAMWQAVERFGFTGGRILEPAAGIGHFIGAMAYP